MERMYFLNPEIDAEMEKNIVKSVGRQIRRFRKQKGLTLELLGGRAGVCPKYLGEIERGRTNPTLIMIHKIALALQKDIAELLHKDMSGNSIYMERITALLKGKREARVSSVVKALELLLDEAED